MTTLPPPSANPATDERAPGEIITFYSYKGGTGRSMALANVGCLLAERARAEGRDVLLVDWDLEAPGLHRYFHESFGDSAKVRAEMLKRFPDERVAEGAESYADAGPGLIDLFGRLDEATPAEGYKDEFEGAGHAERLAEEFSVRDYALPLKVPNLFLLKAGRFDEEYSNLVNTFDWEGLHRRSPWLIRALADRWADEFAYVLIDSRTGFTDTSGICTMLLPEKLVVVFTPNRQSFTGVTNLVRRATRYRKESEDLRPLLVFPLPSRIEASLSDLRNHWRFGNPGREIVGYQPMFEELFREVYRLGPGECDLSGYFEEVQVQQTPDYAYGEEIAVLAERQRDRFSLTRSFETFAERLLRDEGPWARPPAPPTPAAPAPDAKARALAAADALFARLSPDEQKRALRFLTRLATVAPSNPTGESFTGTGRAPEPVRLSHIEPEAKPAADALIESGLVVRAQGGDGDDAALELADESLARDWEPLRAWINENRDFLYWRQRLQTYLGDWGRGGRTAEDLLSGSALTAARHYLSARPSDLNALEATFIYESNRRRRLQTVVRVVGFVALLSILGLVGWLSYVLLFKSQPVPPENRNVAYPGNQNAAYPSPSPAGADLSLEEWKKTGTVYIFYASGKEAAAARGLGSTLAASGYKVAEPERKSVRRDYNFAYIFYKDEGEVAGTNIYVITHDFATKRGEWPPSARPFLTEADNIPGNRIEIWVPAPPEANEVPGPAPNYPTR